jgi:hypothetical protein
MDRERKEKELEEWLDSALAEYGKAEPRAGMESRVIAHLRSHAGQESRSFNWRHAFWVYAGVITVLLFLIVLPPRGQRDHPTEEVTGSDHELLLGIDGLLDREVPAALQPALVLTKEIAKNKKD